MNEQTQLGLKVLVERAVRPVDALLDRKKPMREELLAHVTAVFEEEVARSGNEEAALTATEARFGDPVQIAAELQRTVPAYERPYLAIERITMARPGESVLRFAFRTAAVIGAIVFVSLLVCMVPVALLKGEPYQLSILATVVVTVGVGCTLLTFAFIPLSVALQNALFRGERRSYGVAFLVLLISVATPSVVVFPLYCIVTGDLGWSIATTLRATVLSPLIPFVLLITSWKLHQERQYRQEWASLSIE